MMGSSRIGISVRLDVTGHYGCFSRWDQLLHLKPAKPAESESESKVMELDELELESEESELESESEPESESESNSMDCEDSEEASSLEEPP